MKTPEELLADFEKQQAALDAEFEKLGLPPLDASLSEADLLKDYPPILRAVLEAQNLTAELQRLIDENPDQAEQLEEGCGCLLAFWRAPG